MSRSGSGGRMNEDDLEKIQQFVSEQFTKFAERDRTGIVSLWNDEGSRVFSEGICMHQLYDVMLDVGKRLAMLPPSMPELVEGHHLVKSGGDLDDFAVEVAMSLPPEYQSIIVVFGDRDQNEGDTVFCMGNPSLLTTLAMRSVVAAEELGGGCPDAHIPDGINN